MLIQRKEGNIGWWAKARNSLNSWLDIDARPSRSVGRDSASWSTSTVFGWSFRNVLEKVPRNYFFLKTHFISRRPSGVAIVWMYKGVKGWAETIQTKVTKHKVAKRCNLRAIDYFQGSGGLQFEAHIVRSRKTAESFQSIILRFWNARQIPTQHLLHCYRDCS